jgi:membrane-associated phospholipid phosphatase
MTLDARWYLDINRFARATAWAHGFMHFYALYGGVVLLGLLLVANWWVCYRSGRIGLVSRAVWAAAGTVAAVGVNQPVAHLAARPRPYQTLRSVEVLVPRAHDFSFPSDHAVAAGAVIAGIWLCRHRLLGVLAIVVGLFLAFARVYVGAHYPGDVAAGLALGAAVVLLFAPAALAILRAALGWLASTPLRPLVTRQPVPKNARAVVGSTTGDAKPGQ